MKAHSKLTFSLLIGVVVLIVVLMWQAISASRSHLGAAENVLQEYAMLIADEYIRRAKNQIGYTGYYRLLESLQEQTIDPAQPQPIEVLRQSFPANLQPVVPLAKGFFIFDRTAEDLTLIGLNLDASTESWLLQQLSEPLTDEQSREAFIRFVRSDTEVQRFVASAPSASTLIGFQVDPEQLELWLKNSFEREPLAPQSIAAGKLNNQSIALRVIDLNGNRLFTSKGRYDPYLFVEQTTGASYGGVLEGTKVRVSIDPSLAPELVIGGLPRTRVPLLILLIVVTVIVGGIVLRQLFREQALMRMRNDFVSQVSHELRTPLTQIRMFAESLLFNRLNSQTDQQRALEIINRESQRLSHLVDNVLRFSSVRKKHLNLNTAPIVLSETIEEVLSQYDTFFKSKDIRLALDLDPSVIALADPEAVRQVLVNLLDNALKYGPDRQTIQVGLSKNGSFAQVRIQDSGPGIPPGEWDKVWQPYYRMSREKTKAIAGTGIGLTVCRELIENMQGQCRVEQNDGQGACFVFTLPLETES